MSIGDVLSCFLRRIHKLSSSLHWDLISSKGASRKGTSRYTGFICRTTADIFRSMGLESAAGGGGAGRCGTVPKGGAVVALSQWKRLIWSTAAAWLEEFSDFRRPSALYSDFDCPSPILAGCCRQARMNQLETLRQVSLLANNTLLKTYRNTNLLNN